MIRKKGKEITNNFYNVMITSMSYAELNVPHFALDLNQCDLHHKIAFLWFSDSSSEFHLWFVFPCTVVDMVPSHIPVVSSVFSNWLRSALTRERRYCTTGFGFGFRFYN